MDNEYLKRIYGLLESGATLGTGAVSGLVGLPYGLYKGVTSGAYGTPEAPRIAAREAQQFMERNTYQPRTAEGQENLRQLAGLLEASKLPPVMPEASLLAAIPKQAYAAQAERAGMAAERAIEPVVTRTMERGGLPAQLLGDLSQGSIRPMDVWHGTPHRFDKFDASKIGTGEGAQAYGHGLYFGEARGTGEEYRRALTGNHAGDQFIPTVDGNPVDTPVVRNLIRNGQTPEQFISSMQKKLDSQTSALKTASKEDELGLGITDYDMAEMALGETKKLIDEAKGYIGKDIKAESLGYLYKVDLPDEAIAKMLDWEKPVSKQKNVMDALNNIAEKNVKARVRGDIENEIRMSGVLPQDQVSGDWQSQLFGQSDETLSKANEMLNRLADEQMAKIDFKPLIKLELDSMKPVENTWGMTGKEFYEMLSKRQGGAEKASDILQKQDVTGIRYLDQGSRSPGGSDTSNFVIFPGNENLLTIKEINDKPVGGLLAESAPAQALPGVSIQGGEKPLRSAVVLVGDKVFFGNTHTDAIGQAIKEGVIKKEAGKFIYPEGAEVDMDLFLTNEGQIIDRLQAYKMMDVGASESANQVGIMQQHAPSSMTVDEYMKQANAIRQQREKQSLLD